MIEIVLIGNWEFYMGHEKFKNFVFRQNDFVIEKGCLLLHARVVILLKICFISVTKLPSQAKYE